MSAEAVMGRGCGVDGLGEATPIRLVKDAFGPAEGGCGEEAGEDGETARAAA